MIVTGDLCKSDVYWCQPKKQCEGIVYICRVSLMNYYKERLGGTPLVWFLYACVVVGGHFPDCRDATTWQQLESCVHRQSVGDKVSHP